MKLIIEIPEEEYTKMLNGEFNVTVFNEAAKNGTPLPNGLQGVYDEGYEDGKHDGYCSSIIEQGIEQSHYKDDYEVKE